MLSILCGESRLTYGTKNNATNLCSASRQKLAYHSASVPRMHHLCKQIFATFVILSVNEMDTRREHSPFKYSIVHFLSLPVIRNSSYLRKVLPERPMDDGVTDRAFFGVVEPVTERSVSEIEKGNELTSSQDSPSAKRGYVFVVLHLSLAELQGGRHAHPL